MAIIGNIAGLVSLICFILMLSMIFSGAAMVSMLGGNS